MTPPSNFAENVPTSLERRYSGRYGSNVFKTVRLDFTGPIVVEISYAKVTKNDLLRKHKIFVLSQNAIFGNFGIGYFLNYWSDEIETYRFENFRSISTRIAPLGRCRNILREIGWGGVITKHLCLG